jgi:hypothetical protein
MTDYLTLYPLLFNNGDLERRVHVAVNKLAGYIQIEDPGVPNHAARLAWSTSVLMSPGGWSAAVGTTLAFCRANQSVIDLVTNPGALPADIDYAVQYTLETIALGHMLANG